MFLAGQVTRVPWPVKRVGLALKLYENSWSLAFVALFLGSLAMHAVEGSAPTTRNNVNTGLPA